MIRNGRVPNCIIGYIVKVPMSDNASIYGQIQQHCRIGISRGRRRAIVGSTVRRVSSIRVSQLPNYLYGVWVIAASCLINLAQARFAQNVPHEIHVIAPLAHLYGFWPIDIGWVIPGQIITKERVV